MKIQRKGRRMAQSLLWPGEERDGEAPKPGRIPKGTMSIMVPGFWDQL